MDASRLEVGTPGNDARRSLKDDLLRPEPFASIARVSARGGAKTVELVETHISWVFILENDVFKVKKPVSLGFLDFGTKEQREAACEAEVVLNRRLAPHAYLGVVPVRRGADGRACLFGSGPIVDHAVHMVRLPDAARADERLRAGLLDAAMVDMIARKLAAFHAGCRNDAGTAAFGAPAIIERNVEENFAQTRLVLDNYLRPEEAEELRRWQRSFLRGHHGLFERRASSGRVRDGHGDLRLEHVYLEAADVTIIDCIEFNERFRFADVCADIAFLSMDLAAHGRVDLAERLLAVYAREANDYDLYGVVDFYESYRAYVRGKIAAMLAADPGVDDATRQRANGEARRHFLLAIAAERRSLLLPAVIAVGGVIASGKSTIAERIGDQLSAPVIDADRTRKAMLGVMATERLDDPAWAGAYDPAFTEKVYAEVLRRAAVVLESGRPVVLDASFRSLEMRSAARDLAVQHNAPFRFIECRSPVAVCKARLRKREEQRGVSDGRMAIFDDFCAHFVPVTELPPNEHTALDTRRSGDETAAELRTVLDGWPRGFVA